LIDYTVTDIATYMFSAYLEMSWGTKAQTRISTLRIELYCTVLY